MLSVIPIGRTAKNWEGLGAVRPAKSSPLHSSRSMSNRKLWLRPCSMGCCAGEELCIEHSQLFGLQSEQGMLTCGESIFSPVQQGIPLQDISACTGPSNRNTSDISKTKEEVLAANRMGLYFRSSRWIPLTPRAFRYCSK